MVAKDADTCHLPATSFFAVGDVLSMLLPQPASKNRQQLTAAIRKGFICYRFTSKLTRTVYASNTPKSHIFKSQAILKANTKFAPYSRQ
jgi:hypothetical protein